MKTYGIKPGYQHRTVNATLEEDTGDYWHGTRLLLSRHAQFAVYDLAAKLVKEHGLSSVMDVGCGLGHKLIECVAPVAQRVVAVEQPTVVAEAEKAFAGRGVDFASADFEQPNDTGLGTFDMVLCVDVIEHMLDPDMLLSFIKAHCHADSYVLISTPERDIRRGPENMESPKAEHVREWNQKELADYLGGAGFDIVRQLTLPAFRVGGSWYMFKERFRLFRKGISHRYTQAVVCRPKR